MADSTCIYLGKEKSFGRQPTGSGGCMDTADRHYPILERIRLTTGTLRARKNAMRSRLKSCCLARMNLTVRRIKGNLGVLDSK
jgi:hypothetical protein